MKVKYLAGLAAASVLGMTALTACGPSEPEVVEPDASGEVVAPDAAAPDAMADPAAPDAMADPAEPCAAK
ncbi:MAG: hypothetical protein WBA76_06980 [Phormidesmis sp.]